MKTPTFLIFFLLSLPLFLFGEKSTINIDKISQVEAKAEDKHIMLFFHMERCPYCKKLIKNALSDEDAKKKMKKDYIFLDLNVDDIGLIKYKNFSGNAKELCKNLAIGYYPTIVFIDENNEIIYTMKGYRKVETFNYILDYVTQKRYLETDFAGYLFDIDAE